MPQSSAIFARTTDSTRLSADLSVLEAMLHSGALPEAVDLRELKSLARDISQALGSSDNSSITRGIEAVDKIMDLDLIVEGCCHAIREKVVLGASGVAQVGKWPEGLSPQCIIDAVPGPGARMAAGFGPALAVALGLVGHNRQRVAANFEHNFNADVVSQIKSDTREIAKLQILPPARIRSNPSWLRIEEGLADLSQAIKWELKQFDANSQSCWCLAALSVAAHAPVDQRGFLRQLRDFEVLRHDREARRRAAVTEFFLMTNSFGAEKELGPFTPIGNRARCMEGACISGHPFGVRYDLSERSYYVLTAQKSLGLEKLDSKAGEFVHERGLANIAKFSSLEALKRALPAISWHLAPLQRVEPPDGWNARFEWLAVLEIQASNPKRVADFLEKWRAPGGGSRAVAREICLIGNSFDPEVAARRVKVDFSTLDYVPPHRKMESDQQAVDHEPGSTTTPAARVAHGGLLRTGRPYVIFNPDDPASISINGRQATMAFFQTWAPDRVELGAAEVAKRLRRIRPVVGAASLSELLEEGEEKPLRDPYLSSQLIAQKLALRDELDAEIEQKLAQLDRLVYGGALDKGSKDYILDLQDTGQIPRWFAERYATLPENIRADWDTVNSPLVVLSADPLQKCMTRLVRYYLRHSVMSQDVGLGSWKSDLKWFDAQAEDGEFKRLLKSDVLFSKVPDIHAALATVRPILDSNHALTPNDRLRVLESFPMGSVRQRANEALFKRRIEPYKVDEYALALEYFRPLFRDPESNEWRVEARSDSVPYGILKGKLAGVVLGQRDFAHVQEALSLEAVTGRLKPGAFPDPYFFRVKPIVDFCDMIEGVIVAYRKVQHLKSLLTEENITVPDYEEIGDRLATFHGKLKQRNIALGRTTQARAAEHFGEAHELTLEQVLTRLGSRENIDTKAWGQFIKQGAALGLYSEQKDKASALQALYLEALKLVPTSSAEVAGLLQQFDSFVHHPLVVAVHGSELSKKDYLWPNEIGYIRRVLDSIWPVIKAHEVALADGIEGLKNALEKWRGPLYPEMMIYDGGITAAKPGQPQRLWARGDRFSEWSMPVFEHGKPPQQRPLVIRAMRERYGEGVEYYDPIVLKNLLEKLSGAGHHGYIPVDEEWARKARDIGSPIFSKEVLAHYSPKLDAPSYTSMQSLSGIQAGKSYVSRRLHDLVETLYEKSGR